MTQEVHVAQDYSDGFMAGENWGKNESSPSELERIEHSFGDWSEGKWRAWGMGPGWAQRRRWAEATARRSSACAAAAPGRTATRSTAWSGERRQPVTR